MFECHRYRIGLFPVLKLTAKVGHSPRNKIHQRFTRLKMWDSKFQMSNSRGLLRVANLEPRIEIFLHDDVIKIYLVLLRFD
jgi:hypothetical protein